MREVLLSPPDAMPDNDAILSYHSTPEQAAQTFIQAAPKLTVYTHMVDQTGGARRRSLAARASAGYSGPLEVGHDLTLIEIGDTFPFCVAHRPPTRRSPRLPMRTTRTEAPRAAQ